MLIMVYMLEMYNTWVEMLHQCYHFFHIHSNGRMNSKTLLNLVSILEKKLLRMLEIHVNELLKISKKFVKQRM